MGKGTDNQAEAAIAVLWSSTIFLSAFLYSSFHLFEPNLFSGQLWSCSPLFPLS
jgi:hypothetical protein